MPMKKNELDNEIKSVQIVMVMIMNDISMKMNNKSTDIDDRESDSNDG